VRSPEIVAEQNVSGLGVDRHRARGIELPEQKHFLRAELLAA
jgi:hypothetical protein